MVVNLKKIAKLREVNLRKVGAYLFLVAVLLALYAPIFLVIVYSFTDANGLQWKGFSLELYNRLFVTNVAVKRAIFNTLIIALASSLIATLIGTMTAIGVNVMRKTPKTIFLGINQIPVINADIVVGISLMLLFVSMGLPEGFLTLIIAHSVICTPYVVLSVLPRLMMINSNTYDAALDLGATPTQALYKVLFPQLTLGMRNGFLLAFTLSLDDFVVSKFNNGGIDTISTYIYNRLRVKGMDPTFRALSAIIFLLVLVFLVAYNISSTKRRKYSRKIVNLQAKG